jgi:hypothetical protein
MNPIEKTVSELRSISRQIVDLAFDDASVFECKAFRQAAILAAQASDILAVLQEGRARNER